MVLFEDWFAAWFKASESAVGDLSSSDTAFDFWRTWSLDTLADWDLGAVLAGEPGA